MAIWSDIALPIRQCGMMTRRRAAEIMGETLPDDPMADVLMVTTGSGAAPLQATTTEPSV